MSKVLKFFVCPSTIAMEARVKTSTGCTVQLLMLDNGLWMHMICCILRHRHIVWLTSFDSSIIKIGKSYHAKTLF